MKLNRHSDQGVNVTNASVGGGTPVSVTNSGQKIKRGRKIKPKNSPAVESIKKKKRGRKNVQENQTTATASTSDEDEECSAVNCVRPAGEFRISPLFFCFSFDSCNSGSRIAFVFFNQNDISINLILQVVKSTGYSAMAVATNGITCTAWA